MYEEKRENTTTTTNNNLLSTKCTKILKEYYALLHDCLDLDVFKGDVVFEDNFCHSSLMSHPTLIVPQTYLKHSSTTFGSDTSPCDYL